MSGSSRVEGDTVFCHNCFYQWDRARGGLQCTRCESEHVEIIDNSNPPPIPPHPEFARSPQSPQSPHPLHDHNPWAPDPAEDDITTFEFNTHGGGRGTFSFSSRTYTFGGGNIGASRSTASDDVRNNFEAMLGNIMGFNQRRQQPAPTSPFFDFASTHTEGPFFNNSRGQSQDPFSMLFPGFGQPQAPGHEPSLFDLLMPIFNPANARRGDAVFSQEAFDRVMTQLMEQNTSHAPGPASESAIAALRQKPVDKEMMGNDGKAECSICIDNVSIGDEVTVLPCNHWFHGECVVSWLRAHNTCPHCRQPLTNTGENNRVASPQGRNRTRPRSSSIQSPTSSIRDQGSREHYAFDEANDVRGTRPRSHGAQRASDHRSELSPQHRRSSDRNSRSSDNNSGGGVTGWLRDRLPFSG